MSVTLKCPDCGHTVQAADDTPRTCPECEGTMKKPGYKAKSAPTSSDKAKPKAKPEPLPEDDEPRAKKPAAAKPAPAKQDNPFTFDDEEDDPKPRKAAAKPAKKAEPEPLPLDDEDDAEDAKGHGSTRDGSAAESLEIDPGFRNKKLMRQVEEELSRGEVLYWAGRMHPEIAEKNARNARIVGIVFAALGGLISAVLFAVAPWYAGLIPLLFVAIGVAIAVFGPKLTMKQAELGWYAVTNRRAIVYAASAFGAGGRATSYEPKELRGMRVQKSNAVDGAGDLIFRTDVHDNRTKWVDKRTGRTVKTTGSRTEHHHGFMGIANVREVETLIHNVLLEGEPDRDGDDEE